MFWTVLTPIHGSTGPWETTVSWNACLAPAVNGGHGTKDGEAVEYTGTGGWPYLGLFKGYQDRWKQALRRPIHRLSFLLHVDVLSSCVRPRTCIHLLRGTKSFLTFSLPRLFSLRCELSADGFNCTAFGTTISVLGFAGIHRQDNAVSYLEVWTNRKKQCESLSTIGLDYFQWYRRDNWNRHFFFGQKPSLLRIARTFAFTVHAGVKSEIGWSHSSILDLCWTGKACFTKSLALYWLTYRRSEVHA